MPRRTAGTEMCRVQLPRDRPCPAGGSTPRLLSAIDSPHFGHANPSTPKHSPKQRAPRPPPRLPTPTPRRPLPHTRRTRPRLRSLRTNPTPACTKAVPHLGQPKSSTPDHSANGSFTLAIMTTIRHNTVQKYASGGIVVRSFHLDLGPAGCIGRRR